MMPVRARRYCKVERCEVTSQTNPELSFFALPAENTRRLEWLRAIGREDLENKYNRCYVCETHFHPKDILISSNRKLLKNSSIPSLNLPNQQNSKEKPRSSTTTTTSKLTQIEVKDVSDKESQTPASHIFTLKRKLESDFTDCRKLIKMSENEPKLKKSPQDLFYKLCDQFLSKDLAEMIKANFLECNDNCKQYSEAYKMFCLKLYYVNPQAYRLLEKTMDLPPVNTLNQVYIPIHTKVNDDLITALKIKIDTMSKKEKNCSVIVATMDLNTNLFYNIKNDKIIGFEEVDGIQSPLLAKHVLILIVRGIFGNWEQPIGYALLSERKITANISLWIDKILTKLFEIGLKVRAFLSDFGKDLLNVAQQRSVLVDKPYFYINNAKVYYIFDVPNLISLVHKSLMVYDFYFEDGSVAKSDHIVKFYEQENTRRVEDSHTSLTIVETTKVSSHASRLFNKSVAAGVSAYIDFEVIEESARDTVQFILMVDALNVVLNSSSSHLSHKYKILFFGDDSQVKLLVKMLNLFQTLKLINPINGNDATTNEKFIQGFQITIKSILLLFEDFKQEGYTFLSTKCLNKGGIENFFKKIKSISKNKKTPTSRQFVSAFRKLYFSNLMKLPGEGNYLDDLPKLLLHLKHASNDTTIENKQIDEALVASHQRLQQNECHEIRRSDYSKVDIPKRNVLINVCEVLLRKCIENHEDCKYLKSYMNNSERSQYLLYENYAKENAGNILIVPPDDFVEYVQKMEQIFQNAFEKKHLRNTIGKSIYEQIKGIEIILPCPCFPIDYLQKLFVRFRIYLLIKYNNKPYSTHCNVHKYFCVNIL